MRKFIILIILLFGIIFINSDIKNSNIETSLNEVIENVSFTSAIVESQNDSPIFSSQDIPNDIYEKMLGNSIPLEYKSKVNLDNLSYLKLSYFGFDNQPHVGEMIVNSKLSNDVLSIFQELYDIKYPIEKIKLIDEYNANDESSMSDNNTSCFCYRVISGTTSLSNHAKGTAIDINPLYNPYIANGYVSPASASIYANRNLHSAYQINQNDELYKIFTKYGWSWGGNWSGKKDYQHFEKNI